MIHTSIISTDVLLQNFKHPDWIVIDCRYRLADPELSRQEYRQSHIAGAIYADLNKDLSSRIIPGKTGRHPLPDMQIFTQTISRWGISNDMQVVVYDDAGGAIAAARFWWLMRWLGHEAVAVLDGGWSKWMKEGKPTQSQTEYRLERKYLPHPRPELSFDTGQVLSILNDPTYLLVDTRAHDRYLGLNQSIDPMAGHIPGALNLPYAGNLNPDGTFLGKDDLVERYAKIIGDTPALRVVFYCGSGVTATHNVLAMFHAGLGEAGLYPGSWSEWIADPNRPIES